MAAYNSPTIYCEPSPDGTTFLVADFSPRQIMPSLRDSTFFGLHYPTMNCGAIEYRRSATKRIEGNGQDFERIETARRLDILVRKWLSSKKIITSPRLCVLLFRIPTLTCGAILCRRYATPDSASQKRHIDRQRISNSGHKRVVLVLRVVQDRGDHQQ